MENRRKSSRIVKLGKRGLIAIGIVVTASTLVMGALIVGLMHFDMVGTVVLDGKRQPLLSFDDINIDKAQTDIPLDYDRLIAGDEFTVVHTFVMWSQAYHIVLDTSAMPLEYTDPLDDYYGFTFKIYEHGTTTEISEFDLTCEDIDVDFYYKLDPNFLGMSFEFPFELDMTATAIE